jgi:hypothetical protein
LVLLLLIGLGKGAVCAESVEEKLSMGSPVGRLKSLRMEEKRPVEE